MGTIEVIEAGMLSSVQDLGRSGYQSVGVPEGGAFDRVSLRVGNRLLGNDEHEAGIELTMCGGVFRFLDPAVVCLTGARTNDAAVEVDGRSMPIPHGVPTALGAGSVLRVGELRQGVRAYLCVAGGIRSEVMLGSRSALVSLPDAGLGRALRRGDRLAYGDHAFQGGVSSTTEPAAIEEQISVLRIVPSMHTELFSQEQLKGLCSEPFVVADQSNRAGVRLMGRLIEGAIPGRVSSAGTMVGYVQVPASGEPIVLGVDGPTTGGYPVIGCVIEADLPVLAQCGPREQVRFAWVGRGEARRALLEQEAVVESVRPGAVVGTIRHRPASSQRRVLLGCDTGEAEAGPGRSQELELLAHVSAVSIACGGHAGDNESMRHAIAGAAKHGCVIGAHPSYPDRAGFGRRTMAMDRGSLARSISAQLEAMARHADDHGVAVSYIKAHGALYHDVAQDVGFAHWYWARCALVFPNARFVGPIGSAAIAALRHSGVPTLTEGFCDRVYEPDGSLRSRHAGDALIVDPEQAAAQAERLIHTHGCDLLCVHSDTPDAVEIARAVSERLRVRGLV